MSILVKSTQITLTVKLEIRQTLAKLFTSHVVGYHDGFNLNVDCEEWNTIQEAEEAGMEYVNDFILE